MGSRVEKYKKKRKTKKVIIFTGAVFLAISIGSGVKTTFADVDVSSMLINWFNNKESESIKEIDSAISAEKDLLLADLKVQLQTEMDVAETELNLFTEQVKSERIASLQEHAAKLIANINIDNSEQEAAILSNINSIVENAIAQMDGAATTVEVTTPEPPAKTEPVEVPVNKPEPISEPVPAPVTTTPEPSPITDPIIIPVTDSENVPITETSEDSKPESIPEPNSSPNLSVENVQANRDSSLEEELKE